MSANKSERGLALMRDRDRERGRYFSPRHLLATGAQVVVVCRDCHHFDFLDLTTLPPDLDLRYCDTRFRCARRHRLTVIGIARGPGDAVPPWPWEKAFGKSGRE